MVGAGFVSTSVFALGIFAGATVSAGCSSSDTESGAEADGGTEDARPAAPPSGAVDPDYTGPPHPPAGSPPPTVVDGPELKPCSEATGFLGAKYLDLTAPDGFRQVEWNNRSSPPDQAFQLSSWRCVKVKVGQSFEWDWDGVNNLNVFHVMIDNGGTEPSFVDAAEVSPKKIVATFSVPGTYGYTCGPHPTAMSGVIWVVP